MNTLVIEVLQISFILKESTIFRNNKDDVFTEQYQMNGQIISQEH